MQELAKSVVYLASDGCVQCDPLARDMLHTSRRVLSGGNTPLMIVQPGNTRWDAVLEVTSSFPNRGGTRSRVFTDLCAAHTRLRVQARRHASHVARSSGASYTGRGITRRHEACKGRQKLAAAHGLRVVRVANLWRCGVAAAGAGYWFAWPAGVGQRVRDVPS